MKLFDNIFFITILSIIIIILIILFAKLSLKGENLSLKVFLVKFKDACKNIFNDKLMLVLVLSIIVVIVCYIGILGLNFNVCNSLVVTFVLVTVFLMGIAICIVFSIKIVKDVICNFTNNKKIRIKSFVAIIYPMISILAIRIFFVYISNKELQTFADTKQIIIVIRVIISFGSLIFIPANLFFNIYKGIKECMINAEFVLEDDKNGHRNIKKIKIAIAITWFFIILINSTNIVYFFSSIDSSIFKDVAISQINNLNEVHIMRISSAFYFSLITLLTVGYGDIIPIGAKGRVITSFIAIMGSAYLLIALGSILSDDNSDTIINKIFKGIENKKITIKKDEIKNNKNTKQ